MRDGRAFLGFMSDFWTTIWTDTESLSHLIGASVEVLQRLYLQAVAIAADEVVDEMPLFREDYWHLVYFTEESLSPTDTQPFRYLLPRQYQAIPFLYDRMFDPQDTMREGIDYELETKVNTEFGGAVLEQTPDPLVSYIVFDSDPFEREKAPIRETRGNDGTIVRTLAYWAPKVYTDEGDLAAQFGHLVRIFRSVSSEQYRQLVRGIMYIYTHGPILHPLNAGLSLAAGYPVSRNSGTDVVTDISVQDGFYIIKTQQGFEYEVALTATLKVEVGSTLIPQSSFVRDIEVVDYLSSPMWWAGGPNNVDQDGNTIDPDKRVVNVLGPDLVPVMDEVKRDDPKVIDYMFEHYLKYNVMGLRYDTLAISNFQAIEEFFRVLYEVKPHFVAPYANSYFKTADFFTELVEYTFEDGRRIWVPKDAVTGEPILNATIADIGRMASTARDPMDEPVVTNQTKWSEIHAELELTRQAKADDLGDAAEVWSFPPRILLNAPLRLGANLRVVTQTAKDDLVSLDAEMNPQETTFLSGGKFVLGSRVRLGSFPNGFTIEKFTLHGGLELIDYAIFQEDRCQIIADDGLVAPFYYGDTLAV